MIFNRTFVGTRVPKLTKWVYAISGMGRDAVHTLVSLFYLLYIQYAGVLDQSPQQYRLQFAVITIVMILARLWDGINDPIIGSIIENTHWRMGKYKPWILIGALLTTLAIFMMFLYRPVGWLFVLSFVVFYLLWEISFTLNDIAFWSMLPSLTSLPKTRNELMSLLTMFSAIGAFIVMGAVPLFVAGDAANQYGLIATIVALIFMFSQIMVFLLVQEKARDVEAEKRQEKVSLFAMYKVMLENKPLFWMTWVIFFYYLASSIIINFGLTYFYVSLGYDTGGALLPIIAIIFALSTIGSQLLFPLLTKWLSRRIILKISYILLSLGYILFFFIGNIGYLSFIPISIPILVLIGFFIFSGQGLFYVTILVMLTNTIEYNQWKTGTRNEAVIYSLRPLTAKFASSIQSGFVYLFLLLSGVLTITNQISTLEYLRSTGQLTAQEVIVSANLLIQNFQTNHLLGLTVFKLGMVAIPLIIFTIAYQFVMKKYALDENTYLKMISELENPSFAHNNKTSFPV